MKSRQPLRHLAAALGLILYIICVLPVAAQTSAGVTLSKSSVTVTEASGAGRTATYTVVLDTEPTANVTITITSGDTSIATVSPALLTFTTANWNTQQIVTVTAGQNEDIDHGVSKSVSIYHTPSGRGYGDRDTVLLSVNVLDDDIAGITVTETGGSTATTEAGGADTISVVLDTEPTADVTIAVSSSDTTEGTVDKSSLVFTASNWNTPQIVTVTGQDDNLADGDQSYNIVLAKAVSGDVHYGGSLTVYNAINPADVTVTNADDDAGVMLSTSAVTVTEASAGRSTTYTVKLSIQPSGNVTVTPTSGDTSVARVSPASLTFTTTNWNTAQPITVTGVDDSTDGDRTTTISHTVTGADYTSVSAAIVVVTLTDDDNGPPTGAVTITRTATQGQTLTADTSGISDPDGPSNLMFGYQWKRDGAAISGATSGTYTLTQADVGSAITVTVSWTDAGNTAESLTSAVAVLPSGVTVPAAPAGLTVIVRSGKIKFRWEIPNNPDITGYQYKQWTGNTEPSLGTWVDFSGAMSATTQNRSVRGLTDGTEYNFRILAIAGSVTGTPSGVITVNPSITPDVPARPAAVTAVPGDGQVALSWTNPNNALITKYQIRRQDVTIAPDGGKTSGNWSDWSDIPGSGKDTTGYTVTGLTNGMKYNFRIRAVAGTSSYGKASSAAGARLAIPAALVAAAPPKPTGLAKVIGNGQVTLTWDNPNNLAITGYQYKYWSGTPESGRWSEVSGSDKDTISHVVTGLTNGTKYHFRLRALVGRVAGVKSRSTSATPAVPPVQAAPTAISAQAGYRQVELIWRDPSLRDQKDTTITKYQIKYWSGPSETGAWRDISATINTRHAYYIVTGLTNSVPYNFRLRGLTNGFVVTESNRVQASPVAPPPNTPARPQAVAGDGEITLTWANPNNRDITGYQIRQWTGGGERGSWSAWSDIPGSDKATTGYTVSGLTNGVKYSFRIRAVAGRVTGSQSPYTAVVIPGATPGQPALRAVAGEGEVTLRWSDPTNPTLCTGYQYKQWTGNAEPADGWVDYRAAMPTPSVTW